MKKLVFNLSALAVIAMGGSYLASPLAAAPGDSTTQAECTIGNVTVKGDICTSDGTTCKCA